MDQGGYGNRHAGRAEKRTQERNERAQTRKDAQQLGTSTRPFIPTQRRDLCGSYAGVTFSCLFFVYMARVALFDLPQEHDKANNFLATHRPLGITSRSARTAAVDGDLRGLSCWNARARGRRPSPRRAFQREQGEG